MQNRRIFLTKDEVKQRATELTSSTTDDIWIIYLPLNTSILTNDIHFTYRNKNHTDISFNGRDGYGNYYWIGNDYDILLTHNVLRFLWYYGSYGGMCYMQYLYPSIATSTKSSSSTSNSGISIWNYIIPDSMKEEGLLYIAVDITKAYVSLPGYSNILRDFVMQYKSGEIPEDTLFYEPWP